MLKKPYVTQPESTDQGKRTDNENTQTQRCAEHVGLHQQHFALRLSPQRDTWNPM